MPYSYVVLPLKCASSLVDIVALTRGDAPCAALTVDILRALLVRCGESLKSLNLQSASHVLDYRAAEAISKPFFLRRQRGP